MQFIQIFALGEFPITEILILQKHLVTGDIIGESKIRIKLREIFSYRIDTGFIYEIKLKGIKE